MVNFLVYPRIDEDHRFPPEVNQAIATSPEVHSAVDSRVSAAIAVVEHGTNSNVPRPSGAVITYWFGLAYPMNALPRDIWTTQ